MGYDSEMKIYNSSKSEISVWNQRISACSATRFIILSDNLTFIGVSKKKIS